MKVLNSQGKEIVLNKRESLVSDMVQKHVNSLGYEISITTLTQISKKVSEQKFFQIAPADYMPVVVGEGAWSSSILTYRDYSIADDFESGIVNLATNNSKIAQADAGVDSVSQAVTNWVKGVNWNLMELQVASKSGNWDLVSSKQRSLKKNWDLGIQKVAFLGLSSGTATKGLLNQSGVTNNTSLITLNISSMTPAQLKTFAAGVLEAYRSNCARTAWPTHFVIPESDYNGLASQASPDFPIKSTLQLLEESFKTITRNANFKILPCAYGDDTYSGLGVQRYALYNYDEDSLKMNIPVDFTNTLANSADNFSFFSTAYGQFTGVVAVRPLELLYFSF